MTTPVTEDSTPAEEQHVLILLTVALLWMALSLVLAVGLGRSVRLADELSQSPAAQPRLATSVFSA